MRGVLALVCIAGCYLEPDPPVLGNVAFVTSAVMPATAIQGLAGGDAICNDAAAHAHLSGHFVAWLSITNTPAPSRFGTARGWVRTDRKPFADRISDVVAGRLLYPLRIDENQNDVVMQVFGEQIEVATGTEADGSDGSDCTNFTSVPTGVVYAGVPDATSGSWTHLDAPSCTESLRIYCFGIDVGGDQPIVAHENGKLAFVTEQGFMPGGGIAAADALCASEASDAHLPGTFAAALATQAAALQSRFSGGPWVRVDHVQVTTDFVTFDAPISVTAKGEYTTPQAVWSGAVNSAPASTGDEDCDDWTSTAARGVIGNGGRSDHHALDESTNMSCDIPLPIYCGEK